MGTMTPELFIAWVQTRYQLPNKTASVKKAAELIRTREITIWQWLRGARKASPSMVLLMELVARHY
ncbi:hypothetical protein [Akkermansia sp.]|uniref:hypothetical protein n=1 Tax=Akkermansia sp. TaxID=1872421 RepID=UPI0025BD33AA|nr:hypothetical protein [Akkermansia sp.]